MARTPHQPTPSNSRLRLVIRGTVQGVGFRPFVHRLSADLGLAGWVMNSSQGVVVEVEGANPDLKQFLLRVEKEKPLHSSITSLEATWLQAVGHREFTIRESEPGGPIETLVLPDIATCPDCLQEIFDPSNRRYRYPFTNCTHCGPRFSIIEALPYDRRHTSMRAFAMCAECRAEYVDPQNRRFHAQPNACPTCGPHLELWRLTQDADQAPQTQCDSRGDEALREAVAAIARGAVVAVKGVGGFHLFVDAANEAGVRRLRERKLREEKPFALLFPDVATVRRHCELSAMEERLLQSPEAPITLLRRQSTDPSTAATIRESVAPGHPYLGVMLPSNPLHHLLMHAIGSPVVATSGNLSEEPLCTDEHEAVNRLANIADLFLVHNRPIVRHVDDSIARVVLGREMVLRRARGYAPLPVQLPSSDCRAPRQTLHQSRPVLAVGAHLKNAVALAVGEQVFISQHIGNLETDAAYEAFQQVAHDLQQLYRTTASAIVMDRHPDYLSSQWGVRTGLPVTRIQHHVAHVLSCMAENQLEAPVLGVAWDGTGLGTDGTVWGGEFFLMANGTWRRVAHLRPFQLPGGERAIEEPQRSALGLLHGWLGESAWKQDGLPVIDALSTRERAVFQKLLVQGLHSPFTSSVGRLFDGVAAIIGLHRRRQYEGQAAMALEFAGDTVETNETYPLPLTNGSSARPSTGHPPTPPEQSPLQLDWRPLLEAIVHDIKQGAAPGLMAARFHNALACAVQAVAEKFGQQRVALSGGCFQNRFLLERVVSRLTDAGFEPYWHQRIPPNDGGIALGQIAAAHGGWTEA